MPFGRVKKLHEGLGVGGSIYTGGTERRMVHTGAEVNQPLGIKTVTFTSLLSSLTDRID